MAAGVELATAYFTLAPSMDGAASRIKSELEPALEDAGTKGGTKFSSAFSGQTSKIAGMLTASLAAVGFGKIIGDSISNASDLNEASTAVSAIFGGSTPGIDKWAKESAEALGQSNLEALNAAKTFGIYGQAAGLAEDANASFSTNLAGVASDLASFNNTSPEQAIEALAAGLRGESEPLRAYGILLDDATLRAKALALGIVTTTKDALTPQQRVLAANASIMDQLGASQGDFSKTSEGLANQQRILNAQMTNLSATFGTALLPVIQAILPVLTGFTDWAAANPALIQAIAIAVGILAVAFAVLAVAMWAASVTPIGLIIAGIILAIGLLVAAIVWLVQNWESVVKFVQDALTPMFDWITARGEEFASWWTDMWGGVADFLIGAWEGIVNGIGTAINWIHDTIDSVLHKISDVWKSMWSGMASFLASVFVGIVGVAKGPINGIISLINGAIGALNKLKVTIPDWVPIVGGKTFGLNIPKIPMLAEGGTIMRAGSVIVGENGPEILRLPRGASVDPDIRGAKGSVIQLTQHIYPAQGMSEEQVGRISAERAAFVLRGTQG